MVYALVKLINLFFTQYFFKDIFFGAALNRFSFLLNGSLVGIGGKLNNPVFPSVTTEKCLI